MVGFKADFHPLARDPQRGEPFSRGIRPNPQPQPWIRGYRGGQILELPGVVVVDCACETNRARCGADRRVSRRPRLPAHHLSQYRAFDSGNAGDSDRPGTDAVPSRVRGPAPWFPARRQTGWPGRVYPQCCLAARRARRRSLAHGGCATRGRRQKSKTVENRSPPGTSDET